MNIARRSSQNRGFTLIEVLLSMVILAGALSTMAGLYTVGLRAIEFQSERAALDSALQSQMEILIATDEAALADGSVTVTIESVDHTIDWVVTDVDMDGDIGTDDRVKDIVVTLEDVTLTTRLMSHDGSIEKL